MTTETSEIIEYPIVRYDDLTIDPIYLELQQQGPIRIQLPFGEPAREEDTPRARARLRRFRDATA